MDKDNNGESGYSQEYVEKLRREAAEWRTKYRDLESQSTVTQLSAELVKRGINAEPGWVQIGEGMSVQDAVENFAAKYPHLVGSQAKNTDTPTLPTGFNKLPSIDPPGSGTNTNIPSNPAKGRSLKEVEKDPKARSELREWYRQKIQEASRQRTEI